MTLFEIFQIIIGMFGLSVAAVGLAFVYKQLKHLNESLENNAQSQLYERSAGVRSLIAQYPEVRPYIFEGMDIDEDNPRYGRVRTVAEVYANYLEHLAVLRPNLNTSDWSSWSTIITEVYDNSPIIQRIINERPSWFCESLHQILQERRT